jgi:hypothetical protein
MSASGHGHGHGSGHPSIDDDGIDIKKILIVGVGSLVVFAVSCVVAAVIMHFDNSANDAKGRPPAPAFIGKDEIGIVDQPEFSNDTRLEEWKAAKQRRLNGYGWVDRKKNLIHIPIDKAIDRVVAESAGGGQPQ